MISKNFFRFSPFALTLPRHLTSFSSRNFSQKEHEVLTRFLKQEPQKKTPKSNEEKAKDFKSVYMGSSPDAIVKRRQMHSNYLNIQKQKKESLPQFYQSPGDLFVDFILYMEHHDVESQLVDAVLNYHQVAYKRNDNLLYLDNFKIVNGKNIPNFKFPVMKVLVGLEPEKFLVGYNEIESYLVNSHFILERHHAQNTAFSKQTIDWIQNTVKPNLDMLFWAPILTFQNLFKGSPNTYRGNFRNYMLIRALRLLAQNVIKNICLNYVKIFKNRSQYKKARELVIQNFEDWTKRLGTKPFHGGEQPDEADFEMFAVVQTKHNSGSFRNFLEHKCPDRFYRWFVRMQLKCAYDPERMNLIE